MPISKLHEVIMLQDLQSKLAYLRYDDLNLRNLDLLRNEVSYRIAELTALKSEVIDAKS